MANAHEVQMGSRPPETILPPLDREVQDALAHAEREPEGTARRAALIAVAASHPRCLEAWAALAEDAERRGALVEGYAFARVGYHRGLDALRGAGWRGSGYVRWRHVENRGFLRSLDALRRCAGAIGEEDEEVRCAQFLGVLDPRGGGAIDG